MVLGVAALVAINSFGVNLRETIDEEARSLLGADLSLESSRPFTKEARAMVDSLGGEQSERISFTSMALFPDTGITRLVTVRAIQGNYPYYGSIETDPAAAAGSYLSGRNALVDATLAEQYDLQPGDSVRIGNVSYRIAGRLLKTPRESTAIMLFSPRIFIPLEHLDQSLLGQGSRAEYELYLKFDEGADVEALLDEIAPRLEEQRIGFDTVEEVQRDWNEGLTNLYRFLSLVAFIALLLGGIGVASSVHVYVKQRIQTIAVLRCLGARSWRTVGIYLIQAFAMGLLGGLLGSLIGMAVQVLLPEILQDFLPIDVSFRIVWSALLLGVVLGVLVTVSFAMLPLVAVRRVSPLRALRASYSDDVQGGRDPLRWVISFLIAAGITGFALLQAPRWEVGLGYAGGVVIVFGLLGLVALTIIVAARRFFPSSWPYVWRQGFANLYRPHNQTVIMMLALGLGTFLIATLFLVQRTLLNQIQFAAGEGQPNLVLFDVQPSQRDSVATIVRSQGLVVLDSVPIVTMRIASVKGVPVDTLRADSTREGRWALRREYRSTYRDYLTASEKVIAGTFQGKMPEDAGDPTAPGGSAAVPVSLEQEIADELDVTIGDSLEFNISGINMRTIVSSIRTVDWRQLSTNFFVVFPSGSLDAAPQFHVLMTRVPDREASAALQTAVVTAFPNVSAIDLSLILDIFDVIFSRVAFVIRFMALFSIFTGIIVLAGAVIVSRYQRAEESVLLKTLGASRSQIFRITLIEYLFLGAFAALTGLVLAFIAGWALAQFVFETPFVPDYPTATLTLVAVVSLTVAIGLLNSRGIYDRPPLEVLRAEV